MESPSAKSYTKVKGFANTHGPMYEVKLAAILFLRCKNRKFIIHFQLATNVENAGALDDVVLKFKSAHDRDVWWTWFVQLKHKDNANVNSNALTSSEGDFSLLKYLKSYVKVKQIFMREGDRPILFDGDLENCSFILYTNAPAAKKLVERTRCNREEEMNHTLLKSNSDTEIIINLSEDGDHDIFSAVCQAEETSHDAKEFLLKLKLFCGQPTEKELDVIIKEELMINCDSSITDIELMFCFYLEALKKWWLESNIILDENSAILEECKHQVKVETMSSKLERDYQLNINFTVDGCLDLLSSELHEKCTLLHIVSTQVTTKLSCTRYLKLIQNEKDSYIFLNLDTLLREQNEIIPVWQKGLKNQLIIVNDISNEDINICMRLSEVMKEDPLKKIVLVAPKGDFIIKNLQQNLFCSFKEIDHSFDLQQVETQYREQIFETKVLFQGQSIALKFLLREGADLSTSVMTDNFLETLATQMVLSIGPEPPDIVDYYIPRTLIRRNTLKLDVLNARELKETFVISGMTVDQLQHLLPSDERVARVGSPGCVDCRFLVADSASVEVDVVNLKGTHKNLHWLHMENGKFVWQRPSGSITNLKWYIDPIADSCINLNNAMELSDRVVLLAAEPGMGKSTLVSYLARQTKEAYPSLWVILINLNNHTMLLEKNLCENAFDFLVAAVGIEKKPSLEYSHFETCFKETGNVVVFLDGFDEIAPTYIRKGCMLLTSFLESKVKRVWVTSRLSMNDTLEQHLSTLSFKLKHFTEEDQRSFFQKFWGNKTNPSVSKEKVDEFVTELLQLLAHSLNDEEKEFTGIPLQTLMLAEVFEDYVLHPTKIRLPEKLNLLQLFETVVEKKFMIYAKRRFLFVNKNSKYEMSELRKGFVKNHVHAALVLLLSNDQIQGLHSKDKILNRFNKFVTFIVECKDKTGIIDSVVNGKPNFLHRTFAEYFVALWFSHKFTRNREFLKNHLFVVHFGVIRNMFDRMLASDSEMHATVLNKDIQSVSTLLQNCQSNTKVTDRGGRSPLHLAGALGFTYKKRYVRSESSVDDGVQSKQMVEVLLAAGADVNAIDVVMQWTPLEYAFGTKSWDAVEYLLSAKPNMDNITISEEYIMNENYWDIVINSGFVRSMEFLLDQKLPIESRFHDKYNATLLHKAAAYGCNAIVQLLISRGADIKARNKQRAIPLHWPAWYGHLPVIQTLLDSLGSSPESVVEYLNIPGRWNRTAMHWATVRGHFHVVALLIKNGAGITFQDKEGKTPLHLAAVYDRISIAQALLDTVVGSQESRDNYINTRDVGGQTALHRSLSEDVANLLIAKDGDIRASDKWGSTPLHVACERGNANVVRALVGSVDDDKMAVVKYVNTRDMDGQCALHVASTEEIVGYLVGNGGDVWARDRVEATPLHVACEWGRLPAVQALIRSFGNDGDELLKYMNARNANGHSAQDCCAESSTSGLSSKEDRATVSSWLKSMLIELHIVDS